MACACVLRRMDTGSQPIVLLLHGNAVTSADMEISGLIDELKDRYRVIAFDRPGYGYSERPRDTTWTPEAQADLFAKALEQVKVETVLVFGHSWGTLVAVACALRHPQLVKGLVLASGYYFPTPRSDVIVGSIGAMPLFGDLMRWTIGALQQGALRLDCLNASLGELAQVIAWQKSPESDAYSYVARAIIVA